MGIDLAVVVLTQGRRAHLVELLDSIDAQDPTGAGVLIIDNGSNDGTYAVASQWSRRSRIPATCIRWNENSPSPLAEIVELVDRIFGASWVTFPGDDDVMEQGHLAELCNAFAADSNLTLVGSGVSLMEQSGRLTGDRWVPPSMFGRSREEVVGKLLHRPIFPWPALAFRVEALPTEIPPLRWTLDWWVQIQCALAGSVASLNSTTVRYRQHSSQESVLISNVRKRYEAIWMLNLAISSSPFRDFLTTMNGPQAQVLLGHMLQAGGPLYGDVPLRGAVLIPLMSTLSRDARSCEAGLTLEAALQEELGLIPEPSLSGGWLVQLAHASHDPTRCALPPVGVGEAVCSRVESILRLGGLSRSDDSTLSVTCVHSLTVGTTRENGTRILVSCQSDSSDETLAGEVRFKVRAAWEDSRGSSIGLTPGERKAVDLFNRLKARLPRKVRMRLRDFWKV